MKRFPFFLTVALVCASTAAIYSQAPKPQPPAAHPATPAAAVAKPVDKAAPAVNVKENAANAEFEKFKADQQTTKNAVEVAHEWFRRLNALDGSKESIDRFVDLYLPDAQQISGPHGDDQIGTSMFEGRDMIRKFAEKTAKDYTRIAYFIRQRTVNNKTAELLVANVGAWGDVNMALEFSGSVNVLGGKTADRDGGNNAPAGGAKGLDSSKEKRFTVPGAAFFDVRNGKISRIRIIYASGESFPVGGSWVLSL
jgi:hypothetical protein